MKETETVDALHCIAQGDDTKDQPKEVKPFLRSLSRRGLIEREKISLGKNSKGKRIVVFGWFITSSGLKYIDSFFKNRESLGIKL